MSIPSQPWVIVPGNHDGVHRGHQSLLLEARRCADGLPVVPVFFDPHPAQLLHPERAPQPLTTPERRTALLLQAGANHVICEPFTHALAAMQPAKFATDVLATKWGARFVVCGPDFRFGHKRAGDIETLRDIGRTQGFEVRAIDAAKLGEQSISSTWIRAQVASGRVEKAAEALGRFHEAEGTVVMGQQKGRTIRVPTANLDGVETVLPADGVYAAVVRVLAADTPRVYAAALNLGQRPTLQAGKALEAHLLDFDGGSDSLYGKTLRVGFVARLRDEQKFPDFDALRRQIGEDIEQARTVAVRALQDQDKLQWF